MNTIPLQFYKTLLDNIHDGVYFIDTTGRIMYWNKGAERLTGYLASEVIGSRCSEGLLMHVDEHGESLCGPKCPLAASIHDGLTRQIEVYMHHKNGHRLPVLIKSSPIYAENKTISGAVEIFSDNTSKISALTRINTLMTETLTDPLTGVGNRRFTDITLRSRFDEMVRYGWQFGVLFLDIDHFKDINDTYGHDTGDEILRMVAQTLQNSIRSFDFVGRYGGEEFVILLPNITLNDLEIFATRCRNLVQTSQIVHQGHMIRVTVSVGATITQKSDTPKSILKRADRLMYKSKNAGRNCVSLDGDACEFNEILYAEAASNEPI